MIPHLGPALGPGPGGCGARRGLARPRKQRGDPVPRVPPTPLPAARMEGVGAHLADVEVHGRPLAAHGAVGDVAGGGQRQQAQQAAGEAGERHGAGSGSEFGGRGWVCDPVFLCPGPRGRALPKRAGECVVTAGRCGSGPVPPARPVICCGRLGGGHCLV